MIKEVRVIMRAFLIKVIILGTCIYSSYCIAKLKSGQCYQIIFP